MYGQLFHLLLCGSLKKFTRMSDDIARDIQTTKDALSPMSRNLPPGNINWLPSGLRN